MTVLTPEQIERFRLSARRRQERRVQELACRREAAWALSREAAALLRQTFGATRIAVLGSLVHPTRFTQWSDIDIAAWGIEPADTLRAMGAVWDLSSEFEVNLVDVNTVRPAFLQTIEDEGIEV